MGDRKTLTLLAIGFGGLLALLVIAGINALSVTRKIEDRNEQIGGGYVGRSVLLEQLRSNIYLSGTHVRDLLLEPNEENAEVYREEFEETRANIEAAMQSYRRILSPQQTPPFRYLESELTGYFNTLKPALSWNAEQRKQLGQTFIRDEVLRRRMMMINLADQVSQENHRQLSRGTAQVQELFAAFRNRLYWAVGITSLLGLALAIVSTTQVLRLEQAAMQRHRETEQARSELQKLSAKLLDAQELERRAISRELHDEVGQSLSALLLGVNNLESGLRISEQAAASQQIQELRKLAETSMANVRNLSLLLRPSMLDDLGLVPALQWQAREVSRSSGLQVQVDAANVSEALPEEHKTCIYRVAQEALRNCQRHAAATTIRISVDEGADRIALRIEDNGHGFRPDRERGLGLLGMEERVHQLHGSLDIQSREGQGTTLLVTLPLHGNGRA